MATVIIRPNDDLGTTDFVPSTGSDCYACIDESVLDTGDYINSFTLDPGDPMYFYAGYTSTGLSSETINSITIKFNGSQDVEDTASVIRVNGQTTSIAINKSGSNWSVTLSANPATDSAWTVSDLNSLEIGYLFDAYKATVYIYQHYVEVDYTSGGAQNYTLSCAAGSYSLAGVACTLTYTPAAQNLTLSCGAGSLALTGSACTLSVKRNYTLACNAGSYALTGSAVSFEVKRNYVLSCSAGSLTLTGSACTLSVKRNFALSCSAGSYAVTGTSASLTKNLVMACESGGAYPNIVVSGAGTSDANGTYTYAGESYGKPYYSLDGSVDNLIYWVDVLTYKLWIIANNTGVLYESTDDVATPDLCTTWTTDGALGSLPVPTVAAGTSLGYILTGSDCTLAKTGSFTLTAEAGSYALTGSDVSFGNTKAYELVCGAGSYALTGSDVTLSVKRNFALSCSAGSYTLTGLEADLFKRLVMPCGNGSYILTGSPATINSARTFALGMGSYVLVGTDVGLYILTATPDCRTYFIDAENRTMEVRCH